MYNMYISRKAKNRASAYLLVISVVAILALIGSVFLMTSIDDRRESDARLEVAPVRAVADQVVSMIQLALVDDLCIGPNGPYTVEPIMASDMGEVSWRAYIDYASGDPTDPYDSFLASTERALSDSVYAKAGCWPKVTNLYGFDGALVTNVNPAWEYIPTRTRTSSNTEPIECYFHNRVSYTNTVQMTAIEDSGQVSLTDVFGDGDSSTPDAIPLIDTDGDEVRDALLFPTGSYSGTGSQYYAAVRVVDLSAFVNVNVAMNNSPNGFSYGRDIAGKNLTVGMIDPSKLPRFWPDITQHGPAAISTATVREDAWAFKDTDDIDNPDNDWDTNEIYAPGYAWLPRNTQLTTLVLDEGLPRDSGTWPASSLPSGAPDTSGRGVDNTDADFHYMQYYHGYVKRMGDPDDNGGDSIFRPFDISDEFACRWLDSARWLNQETFDENSTPLSNTNNANIATAHKLKSSRIARLLEDYVLYEGNPGSAGFTQFDNVDDDGDGDDYEQWLDWAYYSRYLTTMSSSRELARYRPMRIDDPGTPLVVEGLTDSVFAGASAADRAAAEIARWPVPSRKVAINRPLTTTAEKLEAFHAYRVAFAWSLGLDISMSTGDREKIYRRACGLALMLIDYLDADDDISCVDLNEVGGVTATSNDGCLGTGTTQYIYGHERTPVISHYWSKTVPVESTTTPGFIDYSDETVIIVIHNPYLHDIDLQDWDLVSDFSIDLDGITLGGGEYLYITKDAAAVELNALYDVIEVAPHDLDAQATLSLLAPATDLSLPAGSPTELVEVSYLHAEDGVPDSVKLGSYIDPPLKYPPGDPMPMPAEALYTLVVRDFDSVTGIRTPLYECYQSTNPAAELAPIPDMLKDYSTGSGNTFLDDPAMVPFPKATHIYFNTLPELPIFVRGYDGDKGQLLSLAELNRLFDFGEPVDKWNSIESQMVTMLSDPAYSYSVNHDAVSDFALGALNFTNVPNDAYGTSINDAFYVQVPDYCRLSNYFTVNDTLADGIDNDGDGETDPSPVWNAATMRELAIPGRININTAPVATLCTLPFLENSEDDLLEIAANMVAYRDKTAPIFSTSWTGEDFSNNRNSVGSDLREQLGFATTGEMAAFMRKFGGPRSNYIADGGPAYGAGDDPDGKDDGYPVDSALDPVLTDDITKYDMQWTYLSNLLTVNSDTYCAYIWVQEGPDLNAEGRRYVVVLDRTNCCKPGDKPEIRGFMEIPSY